MKFSLLVMTPGKQEGKAIEVKLSQFLVGRDPQCHLRPASPMISKRHCALIQRDDKVFVRDFGSTNGTQVNDEPVEGEKELHQGDRLKIGPLLFGIQIEAGAPAPSRPTPAPPTKAPAETPNEAAAKQPSTSSATPPPATVGTKAPEKSASSDEDDIAAMLLSLQDDGPTTLSGAHSPLPDVPDGSTVHELPAVTGDLKPPEGAAAPASEGATSAPKGDTEKAKDKAKAATGSTSSAAKNILDKMMRRPRQQ